MIPAAVITGWAQQHPWSTLAQVEQDLVLSRALVQIYSNPLLRAKLVFRGGTALHKLLMAPAARYSEDLDFVQIERGPIGAVLDALRRELNPWLGEPRSSSSVQGSTLLYRFTSEQPPVVNLRLKIEINTREHFHVHPLEAIPFQVDTRWFSGAASVTVYRPGELLGTKLRALYQRRKGRDLFDLWHAEQAGILDPAIVTEVFRHYMQQEGHPVDRRTFSANLRAKLQSPAFLSDTPALLRPGIPYDPAQAAAQIEDRLLSLLP